MVDSELKESADLQKITTLGHCWTKNNTGSCFSSPSCDGKSLIKYRCSACHIIIHPDCTATLQQACKNRRFENSEESSSESVLHIHHWVHRFKLHGNCNVCYKPLRTPQKGSGQRHMGICCSWCKMKLHPNSSCFTESIEKAVCDMGIFKNFIIPPLICAELIKNEQNLLKGLEKNAINFEELESLGVIMPAKPLLIFVNPKSGGNLGEKLLREFRWFLNPDQIFDVFETPINIGIQRFISVPRLHVLVCGGDGTVSWLYSELDKLNRATLDPVVGLMPLGTGNDLARALKWGGEYNDVNPAPFLRLLDTAKTVLLDRWILKVKNRVVTNEQSKSRSSSTIESSDQSKKVSKKLPSSSFTNYFSFGLDAEVAMNFHCNRAAKPEMYSNRLMNKFHYGRIGLISMLKNNHKHLYETLESFMVDDEEQVQKVIEMKPKCILLININSYSAGTSPWGNDESKEFKKQKIDDQLIEVVFLDSSRMIMLHIGIAAKRFAQCKKVQFVTKDVVPMQVDGEPCLLEPSTITVSFYKQSPVFERSCDPGSPSVKIIGRNSTSSIDKVTPLSSMATLNSDENCMLEPEVVDIQTSEPRNSNSAENKPNLHQATSKSNSKLRKTCRANKSATRLTNSEYELYSTNEDSDQSANDSAHNSLSIDPAADTDMPSVFEESIIMDEYYYDDCASSRMTEQKESGDSNIESMMCNHTVFFDLPESDNEEKETADEYSDKLRNLEHLTSLNEKVDIDDKDLIELNIESPNYVEASSEKSISE